MSIFASNGIGSLVRVIMGLVFTIISLKFVSPAIFAQFAVFAVFIMIAAMFVESGSNSYIIHSDGISDREIGGIALFQLIMALFVGISIIAASDLISNYYKFDLLEDSLRLSLATSLCVGIYSTRVALLKKSGQFKKFQTISNVSYFLAYFIFGLPVLVYINGYWGLVLSLCLFYLFQALIYPFILGINQEILEMPKPSFFKFSSKILLTNISNFLFFNVESFILSKYIPITDFGKYNRYNTLFSIIPSVASSTMQGPIQSISSRIKSDQTQIVLMYLKYTSLVVTLLYPVYVMLFFYGKDVIIRFFGDQWMMSDDYIFSLLSIMAISALYIIPGPILNGLGIIKPEMILTILSLGLLCIMNVSLRGELEILQIILISKLFFSIGINVSAIIYLKIGYKILIGNLISLTTLVISVSSVLLLIRNSIDVFEIKLILSLAFLMFFWLLLYKSKSIKLPDSRGIR